MTTQTPVAAELPEAQRLANAVEQFGGATAYQAAAELRRLHAANSSLKFTFDEWIAKTEWVQQSLKPRELGMHRADILHARITALEAQLEAREAGFSAADMATAAAQGFRDGQASLSLPAEGQEPPPIHALMCVISSLRDTAHFSDEEGEVTNDLRKLRDWVTERAAAPQPAVAVPSDDMVLAAALAVAPAQPAAQPDPAQDDEREAFERFSKGRVLARSTSNPDEYGSTWVQDDWHTWKCAWSAARAPADSVTAPAGECENLDLRRMLCVAHAGAAAYMDDGEAQDSRELPVIDFLRDTPAEIQDKLQRRVLKKLAAGAAPTPPAQAADSVLEDAARWRDWSQAFAEASAAPEDTFFMKAFEDAIGDSDAPFTAEQFTSWVDAARKQGANHD